MLTNPNVHALSGKRTTRYWRVRNRSLNFETTFEEYMNTADVSGHSPSSVGPVRIVDLDERL
jgi:hypothetical protein